MTQPIAKGVHTAKKYVDLANKGATRLKAFSVASKKLRDKGNTLNELEAAAADLKYLGQVTTVLECASVGFAVLSAVLPVPTVDDQILDAVKANMGAIEGLSKKMTTQFNHLKNGQTISSGLTDLLASTRVLRSGQDALNRLMDNPTDTVALHDLTSISASDLDVALQGVLDYIDALTADTRLFALLYDDTYGQAQPMTEVATSMNDCATSFLALRTWVEAHINGTSDDAGREAAAQQVGNDYDAKLARIHQTTADWIDKCLDRNDIRIQVNSYIDNELAGDFDADDKQALTDMIVEKVTEHYPHLCVSALATPPMSGLDHHSSFFQGHNSIVKFGRKDGANLASKTFDLFVTWRGRPDGLHSPQRIPTRNSVEDIPAAQRTPTEASMAIVANLLNVPDKHAQYLIKRIDTSGPRTLFKAQLKLNANDVHITSRYMWVTCLLVLNVDFGVTSGTHFAYSPGPLNKRATYWQFAFWI